MHDSWPPKPTWWDGIKMCHEHADRQKWLDIKNDGSLVAMSASEAAIVLQEPHGKHPPHMTPEQLAEVKRGERVPDLVQNEAMWFGSKLEPIVLERLAELYPEDAYEAFGWLCHDQSVRWMCATPDALKLEGGEWVPCQIKVSAYFPSTFEKHGLPMPWQLQVQTEIAVLGTSCAELAVLHLTKRELCRYPIQRDDQLIAVLRSACLTFKREYIDREGENNHATGIVSDGSV